MSDQLIQELETFENVVQNMLTTLKRIETCTKEMKNISAQLEQVAKNTEATLRQQEKMTEMLEQAWSAYSSLESKPHGKIQ